MRNHHISGFNPQNWVLGQSIPQVTSIASQYRAVFRIHKTSTKYTTRENYYCEASFSHLQNKPLVHIRISLIKSWLLVDCGTYPSTFWLISWDIGCTCVTCKTQGRKNKNPNFVIHTSCHLFFITLLLPAVLMTQFIHFRLQNV